MIFGGPGLPASWSASASRSTPAWPISVIARFPGRARQDRRCRFRVPEIARYPHAQDRRLWVAGSGCASASARKEGDARGRESLRGLPRCIMSAPHFERVRSRRHRAHQLLSRSRAAPWTRSRARSSPCARARRRRSITAVQLGLCDRTTPRSRGSLSVGAPTLVVLGTPLSAYAGIAQVDSGVRLKPGAIVTGRGLGQAGR